MIWGCFNIFFPQTGNNFRFLSDLANIVNGKFLEKIVAYELLLNDYIRIF